MLITLSGLLCSTIFPRRVPLLVALAWHRKLRIKMSRINGERDRDCEGAVGEVEEDFPF